MLCGVCGVHRCTIDECDPQTGTCTFKPKAGCCKKDGDCVDPKDQCKVGCCTDGRCVYAPKKCDDGKRCTTDSCDPTTGQCVFKLKACDDNNKCTKDSCDEKTGECKFAATVCEDGKK
jgi:hypothetical protein